MHLGDEPGVEARTARRAGRRTGGPRMFAGGAGVYAEAGAGGLSPIVPVEIVTQRPGFYRGLSKGHAADDAPTSALPQRNPTDGRRRKGM